MISLNLKVLILSMVLYCAAATALVSWHRQTELDAFEKNYQQQTDLAVTAARLGLETLLNGLQTSMALFASSNEALINELLRDPDPHSLVYQGLENRLKRAYPELVAFTLADLQGRPIFEQGNVPVSRDCKDDLTDFARDKNANIRRLHSSLFSNHFDIMTHVNVGNNKTIFFANFEPAMITRNLVQYLRPGVELMLLNREVEDLIEFTTRGARNTYRRNWNLSADEITSIRSKTSIPGSKWDLVAIPVAAYVDGQHQIIEKTTSQVIYVLIVVGLLLLLSITFVSLRVRSVHQKLLDRHDQLEDAAHHDSLTGLPNRLLFRARLELALEQKQRDGGHIAVLFLDLDGFKTINDSFGHAMGDKVLITVASLLNKLRSSDTVARLAGDEFIIMLGNIRTVEDAEHIAEQILSTISSAGQLLGPGKDISASIGISCFPENGQDVDTLINKADQAMYLAKSSGRNSYQSYTERGV